jgi:hypothetical protein
MAVGRQGYFPTAVPPGKWFGTHCTGDLVSPGPAWTVQKISPQPGFDLRTVQTVASHYTDRATSAQSAAAETEI